MSLPALSDALFMATMRGRHFAGDILDGALKDLGLDVAHQNAVEKFDGIRS